MVTRKRWLRVTIFSGLLTSICLTGGCGPETITSELGGWSSPSMPLQPAAVHSVVTETVDVIGGSMAFGWKDPHNDSYTQRAFTYRSLHTRTHYRYINHALPGYTAQWLNEKYPGRYRSWLQHDRPQVVILTWGLENDMSSRHKDSLRTFQNQIRQEISTALHDHAVVLIVSPPITKLLATTDHRRVTDYIDSEFQVGQSFRNPNVVDIHLLEQMQEYMMAHHQTYRRYYGNAWHPNQAGHELAGRLLVDDLNKRFGSGPILFKS